jgi:hypothetical protein
MQVNGKAVDQLPAVSDLAARHQPQELSLERHSSWTKKKSKVISDLCKGSLSGIPVSRLVESPPITREGLAIAKQVVALNWGLVVPDDKWGLLARQILADGWSKAETEWVLDRFLRNHVVPNWSIHDVWRHRWPEVYGHGWYLKQINDSKKEGGDPSIPGRIQMWEVPGSPHPVFTLDEVEVPLRQWDPERVKEWRIEQAKKLLGPGEDLPTETIRQADPLTVPDVDREVIDLRQALEDRERETVALREKVAFLTDRVESFDTLKERQREHREALVCQLEEERARGVRREAQVLRLLIRGSPRS